MTDLQVKVGEWEILRNGGGILVIVGGGDFEMKVWYPYTKYDC